MPDPVVSCSACGHEAPAGSAFCNGCGAAVAGSAPHVAAGFKPAAGKVAPGPGEHAGLRPAATREARPPSAYYPQRLADKIMQSKSALEACPEPGRRGERKQVTVLFADVKGSMELAEQLGPEAFSQIMSRFFQILSEGVERFEGFVDKFKGHGIMARGRDGVQLSAGIRERLVWTVETLAPGAMRY